MVWDKSRPISSNAPKEAPAYFHENWDCLEEGIDREHTYPGTKGSTAGQHKPGACKVLKVDTTINLGAGTGVENAISFDSTKNLLMRDTGSDLVQISSIPKGTKMYFYQNTAPTGWTIDATSADAILAVKGGSDAYNVNGGTQAGTWTQPNHTHTGPSHTHTGPSHRHTGPSHTHSVPRDGWGHTYAANVFGRIMTGGRAENEEQATANNTTGGGGTGNTGYGGSAATGADGTGATSATATPTTYRPLAQIGIICERN